MTMTERPKSAAQLMDPVQKAISVSVHKSTGKPVTVEEYDADKKAQQWTFSTYTKRGLSKPCTHECRGDTVEPPLKPHTS